MQNFNELLNKPVGTVEPPKPVPTGNWFVLIQKAEFGKSQQKQTPYIELTCVLQQPGPDVDPVQLQAFGDFAGKTVRDTFYLTEDSLFRFDQFLTNVMGFTGMSINQAVAQLAGKAYVAQITHQMGKDPANPVVFAQVSARTRAT